MGVVTTPTLFLGGDATTPPSVPGEAEADFDFFTAGLLVLAEAVLESPVFFAGSV